MKYILSKSIVFLYLIVFLLYCMAYIHIHSMIHYLTYWGLVMPIGDIDVGPYLLRLWWQQNITLTNVD